MKFKSVSSIKNILFRNIFNFADRLSWKPRLARSSENAAAVDAEGSSVVVARFRPVHPVSPGSSPSLKDTI